MFYPYDPTLILIIPAVILTIYAQIKVHSTFSKYKKVGTNKAHSGESTAQIILENQGINIPIEQHQRYLSDHYDPLKRVLRLSPEVYHGHSIASIAVAAHEAGHAIQHAEKYWPITLRTAIFPITNFSSWLAPVLILIGLFINALSLIKIGIVLFSFAVFFTIVTLPVEFDASRRCLRSGQNSLRHGKRGVPAGIFPKTDRSASDRYHVAVVGSEVAAGHQQRHAA